MANEPALAAQFSPGSTWSETMKRPKRNQMCPCGSGKKWKKCHGAPQRAAPSGPDVVAGIKFTGLLLDPPAATPFIAAAAAADVATDSDSADCS